MKRLLIALMFLFWFGPALALEPPGEKAVPGTVEAVTYYVTDRLDSKRSRVELWTYRLVPDTAEDPWGEKRMYGAHEIRKEIFGKQGDGVTETHKLWHSEIRTEKKPTYLREVLTPNPAVLDPGERSYGFVEERTVADDRVVMSYPVFYSVKQELRGFYRMTLQIFLPDGKYTEIVRHYREGEYFLPLRESRVVKYGDEVLAYLVFARMR